ncbi:MAG: hypothetical protein AAF842_10675 [Planctomycetota bacterium]
MPQPLRVQDDAAFPPPANGWSPRLAQQRGHKPPLFDAMNHVIRDGHWARLKAAKAHRAMAVLIVLYNHADVQTCRVDGFRRRHLQDEAGVSPHTFIAAIGDLEAAGLVRKIEHTGRHNTYLLLDPQQPTDAPAAGADREPTQARARPQPADGGGARSKARTTGARSSGARHRTPLRTRPAAPPEVSPGPGAAPAGLFDGLPALCVESAQVLVDEVGVGWASAKDAVRHHRPTPEQVRAVVRSVRHLHERGEVRNASPIGLIFHRLKAGEFALHADLANADNHAQHQRRLAARAQAAQATEERQRQRDADREQRERAALESLSNTKAKALGRRCVDRHDTEGKPLMPALRASLVRGDRSCRFAAGLMAQQLRHEGQLK